MCGAGNGPPGTRCMRTSDARCQEVRAAGAAGCKQQQIDSKLRFPHRCYQGWPGTAGVGSQVAESAEVGFSPTNCSHRSPPTARSHCAAPSRHVRAGDTSSVPRHLLNSLYGEQSVFLTPFCRGARGQPAVESRKFLTLMYSLYVLQTLTR